MYHVTAEAHLHTLLLYISLVQCVVKIHTSCYFEYDNMMTCIHAYLLWIVLHNCIKKSETQKILAYEL